MTAEDAERAALEQIARIVERYAAKSGLALQPDIVQLGYVLNGLARNLMRYGRPYCPCREVTGCAQKDRWNICPCRTHREEIVEFGECECGLFTSRSDNQGSEKE